MQPFHFGAPGRRMFGVLRAAPGDTRALVLICPPLLHEHVRSYRLFSQLANRLAEAGLASLRFDYHGTGDAEGEDADFSPERAPAEIVMAAGELRRRAGDFPLVLFGIRASAMFALRAADAAQADALWLWQPVCDGRGYVDALDARYLRECDSRDRFPSRAGPAPVGPDDLMGFRVSPDFRRELCAYRLAIDDAAIPVAIVAGENDELPASARATRHVLPPAATVWADEIDMGKLLQPRDAEDVIQALLSDLPRSQRRVANG